MIRYTLFVLAVAGSAATAWASMVPASHRDAPARNVTVIEKNQFWAVVDKITVEKCNLEDCSDTPQG